MKRIILLCVMLIACITIKAETYVIAVGVSNYGDTNANLYQTTDDVKKFATFMRSRTKYVTAITGSNATSKNVLSKLDAISRLCTEKDTIFFLYRGHGFRGGLYMYKSNLMYKDMIAKLQKSKSKNIFCIIDACFAASVEDDMKGKNITNITCFCASKENEFSWTGGLIQSGFFFHGIMKGMRGLADSNRDKRLTVKELFAYAYADTKEKSKDIQHPSLVCPKEMLNTVIFDWDGFESWYNSIVDDMDD